MVVMLEKLFGKKLTIWDRLNITPSESPQVQEIYKDFEKKTKKPARPKFEEVSFDDLE